MIESEAVAKATIEIAAFFDALANTSDDEFTCTRKLGEGGDFAKVLTEFHEIKKVSEIIDVKKLNEVHYIFSIDLQHKSHSLEKTLSQMRQLDFSVADWAATRLNLMETFQAVSAEFVKVGISVISAQSLQDSASAITKKTFEALTYFETKRD